MPQEGRKRRLPKPPYNPGLRDLVEGKRAWDDCPKDGDARVRSRGWHERGYLPHRDSLGLTQFITYHLADAFPASRLSEWEALLAIEDDRKRRLELETYLDKGCGNCWLRRSDISAVCENAFRHFDTERYELKAWCLMPNHVHVLVKVTTVTMSEFVKSWKGYTGYRANQMLGRTGTKFWATDYWDTYMRDSAQELRAVHYIENNPVKAKLVRDSTDWPWSSARFRDESERLTLPPLTQPQY